MKVRHIVVVPSFFCLFDMAKYAVFYMFMFCLKMIDCFCVKPECHTLR